MNSGDRGPTLVGESRSAFREFKSAKNLIERAEFRPRPHILSMDLRQCESTARLEKTRKDTMTRDSEVDEKRQTRLNKERERESKDRGRIG